VAAVRTWLAIPALAIACAAVAAATGALPIAVLAVGALGAALAAAVRAFAGTSLAATIAAATAALLAALAVVAVADGTLARAALAGAAATFAIAELARPLTAAVSPFPAIGAALVAGVLDPSYVALVAVASARFATGPWPRPRWAIALPLAGVLAVALAVLAAYARTGLLAELWPVWTGRAAHHEPLADLATRAGDVLGPLAVVAALVGLATCAAASRFAAAGVLAAALGAVAVALHDRTLAPAAPIAALTAGVALARLAALVRHPLGQPCVGAAAAVVVLAAPCAGLL
jgi:hypothetical protein